MTKRHALPSLSAVFVLASAGLSLSLGCSDDDPTEVPVGTGGGTLPGSTGGSPSSGGGPVDVGTGGGAAGDSATGGGATVSPSLCDQKDFLLCDGFEDALINTELWSVDDNDGKNVVEISSVRAKRGSQSIHIHAENGRGYLKNQSIFPLPSGDYFGRMYVWVERFSTVAWAHWTLAEAAGTGDGSLIRVGGQYKTDKGQNRFGVGSDGGPTGDWTTHDSDPDGMPLEPATGAWICVEWEHAASRGETQMFIDGTLHPSLSTTAKIHGGNAGADYILPDFTSVWVGWWQYQADPLPFDLYIDEVAFDDERIFCDN